MHDANESQNTSEMPLTVSKYNARKYTHAQKHCLNITGIQSLPAELIPNRSLKTVRRKWKMK